MMMKGLHVLMNYFFRNFVVEGKIFFLMFIMTGTDLGCLRWNEIRYRPTPARRK
jgi:hypothetical protein